MLRRAATRVRRGPLWDIPRSERPLAWQGCLLLATVVGSHAVLETARDTLFLADLPASRLPWAYLAIAVLAVGTGALHRRLGANTARRGALAASLAAGSVVTLGLYAALEAGVESVSPFALYVWTGLLATIVVLQIWLRMGELFDVSTAKAAFAFAASGGLAGAAAGSLLARAALEFVWPHTLVALAAGGLAVAAGVALRFGPAATASASDARRGDDRKKASGAAASLLEVLAASGRDPYLRRVLLLAWIAPVALTAIDYVFKEAVSRHVAADELGPFFASFHAGVNGFALLFQALVVPHLLARFGAIAALAVMPSLLALFAGGAALLGGLLPVIALKAADGALHHSLHRAASEILYLPLGPGQRETTKFAAASFGHRGGQALSSLVLLALIGAGARPSQLAAMAALLCAVWLASFWRLREQYVTRFRAQLVDLEQTEAAEVPKLELHSLEALIASLSSPRDEQVLASLDLLATYERTALVPGLILYHPSPRVVLRALELLDDPEREDARPLVLRLLEHADEEVRSAALQTRHHPCPADRLRECARSDASPRVRATALTRLIASEERGRRPSEALARLGDVLDGAEAQTRLALARTLGALEPSLAAALARRLMEHERADSGLRVEVMRGLAARPSPEFQDAMLLGLDTRDARFDLRRAFVALGTPALTYLGEQLLDPATPDAIRRHLPRSISRFANADAAAWLLRALDVENDPAVRFKILRGLGRMRTDDPALPIDRAPLLREAERSLGRATRMLALRILWQHAEREGSDPRTPGSDLLGLLLAEKEERALERVFRILHILQPSEDFEVLWEGVIGPDRRSHAGSVELLLHTVDDGLRESVVALVGLGQDDERLAKVQAIRPTPLAQQALACADHARNPDNEGERKEAGSEAAGSLARFFQAVFDDPDPVLVALARRTHDEQAIR